MRNLFIHPPLKKIVFIVLIIPALAGSAQPVAERVKARMQRFHSLMTVDRTAIGSFIDDSLTYGHSNGWIENRNEFYSNLGEKIIYHSIKEDSIMVTVNKNMAHIRFVGDLDVTMNGKRNLYHLRVLEVWVKKKGGWKLFARQAIR